jgi:hypothetical protein
MKTRATDWDAYYDRPAPTAHLTRRYTESWLRKAIAAWAPAGSKPWSVIEFGGGNSFCCRTLLRSLPIARYDVVDYNEKSLDLFRRKIGDLAVESAVARTNLLHETPNLEPADVVFSVGLVIITAPTPTLPYRITRRLAETLGVWAFPDERPMAYAEVEALAGDRGRVLTGQTLWPLVLTQRAVAWRAS